MNNEIFSNILLLLFKNQELLNKFIDLQALNHILGANNVNRK